MYGPTHLPKADRDRLAKINQKLLTGISGEEHAELLQEQQEIMGRRKTIRDCTYDELQDLKQQLYDQFQKHSAIGNRQAQMIARFIQQVEIQEADILMRQAQKEQEEQNSTPEKKNESKPASHSRVSTKQSSYSWTVNIDGDD